jgi:hypothetical protein
MLSTDKGARFAEVCVIAAAATFLLGIAGIALLLYFFMPV